MKENIYISGFADEISPDFTEQLKTVTSLGMHYISLRSADGKNIAEYTPDEVREKLMPRLAQYGVKVSSIGSPVGKVGVEDEAGFAEHLAGLERLCEICKLLDCRYIRMFSFFIPHGKDPDSYRDVVEYIMLGATTVQLCTAVMWNGYGQITKILKDLDAWMDQKGYKSFDEIRGIALKDITTVEKLAEMPPLFAEIDADKCTGCGLCKRSCFYRAIEKQGDVCAADKSKCDGCGLCAQLCPAKAITLR